MHTIFLVEDAPKTVSLLQAHLEKHGYAVTSCHDFSQVPNEFERVEPALVLLDITLPRFDGFY